MLEIPGAARPAASPAGRRRRGLRPTQVAAAPLLVCGDYGSRVAGLILHSLASCGRQPVKVTVFAGLAAHGVILIRIKPSKEAGGSATRPELPPPLLLITKKPTNTFRDPLEE